MVARARGKLLGRRGQYAEALGLLQRAQTLTATVAGADSPAQAADFSDMATALRRLGRLDDALAAARRALALDRTLGDAHPYVGKDHGAVAIVLSDLGRLSEARTELEQEIAILVPVYGADSPDVGEAESDLAVVLDRMGKTEDAIAHYRTALAIESRVEPEGSEAITTRGDLARALSLTGHAAEAIPLLREILATQTRTLGPAHPDVGTSRFKLAVALSDDGQLEAASAEYEAAWRLLVAAHADPLRSADFQEEEAEVLRLLRRFPDALALDVGVAAVRAHAAGVDPRAQRRITLAVATDEVALGRFARALPLAESALVARDGDAAADQIAQARFVVAASLWATGGDRRRAIELATTARAIIADAPAGSSGARLRAQIDAWLGGKRAPAR